MPHRDRTIMIKLFCWLKILSKKKKKKCNFVAQINYVQQIINSPHYDIMRSDVSL